MGKLLTEALANLYDDRERVGGLEKRAEVKRTGVGKEKAIKKDLPEPGGAEASETDEVRDHQAHQEASGKLR